MHNFIQPPYFTEQMQNTRYTSCIRLSSIDCMILRLGEIKCEIEIQIL